MKKVRKGRTSKRRRKTIDLSDAIPTAPGENIVDKVRTARAQGLKKRPA